MTIVKRFSVFEEQWRPVAGHEGCYEVSNFGRIRGVARLRRYRHGLCKVREHYLKPRIGNSGYLMATLSKDGKHHHLNIHILVAEAFLGMRPKGLIVHHVDADKSNNFASNLAYISRRQNLKLGSLAYGERHCMAKLKERQVPAIRELAKQGVPQCQIARLYGVKASTIWSVLNSQSWTHVA